MAGALRLVSVQRGHDPREFALVAFGGAGPLHANAVAALMGSFPVIVPPSPGLLCALGDLVADFRNEFARTLIRLASDATPDEVARRPRRARGARPASGWPTRASPPSARRVTFVADMRYHGQGYEIPVPLRSRRSAAAASRARRALQRPARAALRVPDARTRRRRSSTSAPSRTGDLPKPELPEAERGGRRTRSGAIVEQGEILFEGERRPTPIYDRAALRPGNRLAGPAIVTEFDSTTVVLPGYVAEVDRFSNILITPEGAR